MIPECQISISVSVSVSFSRAEMKMKMPSASYKLCTRALPRSSRGRDRVVFLLRSGQMDTLRGNYDSLT